MAVSKQKLESEAFQNQRTYLSKHLRPGDLIDDLITQRLIGESAKQSIELSINTILEKNRLILTELESNREGTLETFCELLRNTRGQEYIAEVLEREFRSVKRKHKLGDDSTDGLSEKLKDMILKANPIEIANFPDVLVELKEILFLWKQLGSQLGLKEWDLNTISAGGSCNHEEHMRKVFELWLQQSLHQTWQDLIIAIENTGSTKYADFCEELWSKHQAELASNVKMKDINSEVLSVMARDWFDFGSNLGIDETQLFNIEPEGISKHFRDMLHTWWSQNLSSGRTWNKVALDLVDIKQRNLAQRIFEKRIKFV